jgi:integrase/recombinase XerD
MTELIPYNPRSSVLPPGTTDDTLINIWVHDLAETTQGEYIRDIAQFRAFVSKPFADVHLGDLQAYKDALTSLGLAPASVARKLRSVKSLFSFAERSGYLSLNVGAALRIKKVRNRLAERILTEEQVLRMIFSQQDNPRNYALVRLLYATGIRVSECCSLEWRDVIARADGGQITVFGKGNKTRTVPFSRDTYEALIEQNEDTLPDMPVFVSRGGGAGKGGDPLSRSQVWMIVEQAAIAAGLHVFKKRTVRKDQEVTLTHSLVSPHWLRHACASHLLDHGAPISFVMSMLGHESMETTAKYSHAKPNMSPAQFLPI